MSDRGLIAVLGIVSSTVARVLAWIAAVLVGMMAIITTVNVVLRATIGTSIPGSVDIVTLGIVSAAYLGLGAAHLERRHVEVVFMADRVRGRLSLVLEAVRAAVMIIFLGTMVWRVSVQALISFDRGEVTNGLLHLWVWPTICLIAIGVVAYLASFLAELAASISEGRRMRSAQIDTAV